MICLYPHNGFCMNSVGASIRMVWPEDGAQAEIDKMASRKGIGINSDIEHAPVTVGPTGHYSGHNAVPGMPSPGFGCPLWNLPGDGTDLVSHNSTIGDAQIREIPVGFLLPVVPNKQYRT